MAGGLNLHFTEDPVETSLISDYEIKMAGFTFATKFNRNQFVPDYYFSQPGEHHVPSNTPVVCLRVALINDPLKWREIPMLLYLVLRCINIEENIFDGSGCDANVFERIGLMIVRDVDCWVQELEFAATLKII
jgi:hypothetical protein